MYERLISSFDFFLCIVFFLNFVDTKELNSRVLITSNFNHVITGGPEAIVQLALAFSDWYPNGTFWYGTTTLSDVYAQEYPDAKKIPYDTHLKKGDIFIIPEVENCNQILVNHGIRQFIWQLGSWNPNINKKNQDLGCGFISHNFWLASHLNINVPRSNILRPYITPTLIPKKNPVNVFRENLVLIDSDTPSNIIDLINLTCTKLSNCSFIVVNGFSRAELLQLFYRAKIVIDWCMRGTERMPIEAILNGVVLLSSYCETAEDSRDIPISSNFIVSNITLKTVMENVFKYFQLSQKKMHQIIMLYKNKINRVSLAEETKVFYKSII